MSLKKNLLNKIKEEPDRKLFFFDESRFGTHSKLGYGWFKKGSRTQVKVKLGYKNFYVYSAVSPRDGETISIIAPKVNSDWMNLYFAEMSKTLGDSKAFIVMDQAGWHKSKNLTIPENISILYLPPYSPELNPVERLWQYIKNNTIKNKIYDRLKELENEICDFLKNLHHDVTKSVCSAGYSLS